MTGPADRRRWRAVVAVAVGLVLVAGLSQVVAEPGRASAEVTGTAAVESPRFGVLGSSCDPDRAVALRAAGVEFVEFGVPWAELQPEPGPFDAGALAALRDRVETCRGAGLRIVLTLGFQYAPDWIADLPSGSYRSQHGAPALARVANVVFSAAVRDAAREYLTELDAAIPLTSFAAVRVGTGESGELGYPGRVFGSSAERNDFWAFDDAAQSGVGLAEGAEVSPMPGWVPGDRRWRGAPVTSEQVRTWFGWYSGSAAEAVVWEIGVVRGLGFAGDVHVPLAGRGALPADLSEATGAGLDGTADRDGSLERGLDYPTQLARIAARTAPFGRVWADVTGVDDATAVTARRLDPPQDSCLPGDPDRDLLGDPTVEDWSATRWTAAVARRAGLGVVGENPGSPSTPGTGGDAGSDPLEEQMVHAPRYARECGFGLLMWAFEDDLFGDGSGVTVADYARRIGSR